MIWQAPNLASDRFVNLRPPRRLALALAVLALGLTAWNAGTWWRSGASDAARAAELETLLTATREARARTETLERDLAATDLEAFNEEAAFLNARIAERIFSWNRLFDHLTEVMPRGVRLRQLAPVRTTETSRRPVDSPADETVTLSIGGEAEDDEALFEFVDRLFADDRFLAPDLSRQSTTAGGQVSFDLSVGYLLPGGAGPLPAADSTEGPQPESAAGQAPEPGSVTTEDPQPDGAAQEAP
ncbi:MAG: hypothetical protein F9K16_10625 [Thermoanaerobaculia bacterium]|nr:MAG: hypothetical protein F9K16_10625 [Thermoanaerobaculia bacterium]